MRFHFKLVLLIGFISRLFGTGTQFLSIPSSAYDLVYFHSPWRNPAAINRINSTPELGFAYGNWLVGTQMASVKWRGQFRKTNSGLDIRYVGLDDIELRIDKPTSQPLGYYTAYGLSIKSLTGWKRGNHNFGVGLQYLNMNIYQESSSGLAIDLGWAWSLREKLTFTLSGLNLGKMNALSELTPRLPQRVISSVIYGDQLYSIFAGAESNSLLKNPIIYAGAQGEYKNLFVGASYMNTNDMKSLTGGIGFHFGIYSVTYGIQWGDQHLGMPKMIDISVRLP